MKNAIKVMGAAAAFVFAFAAEAATETVDGYTWSYRIVDGTAEIYNDGDTAISPDPQGAITIPSTLGGKPVTRIGDSTMSYLGLLTSVKMPASVTSIGSYAFNHCLQLASVEMPGVKEIGANAFLNCSLSSVVMPDDVKTIGNSAFRSYQLSNISIPPSVTTVGSAGIYVGVETIYVAAGGTERAKEVLRDIGLPLDEIDFVEPSGAYTVTLNANGGVCGAPSVKVKKGAAAGDLPAAARKDYAFVGWFTEASGGEKVKF